MKGLRTKELATRLIRYVPGITRQDLAEAMGVSVTTVNPLTAGLLDRRLVREVALPAASGTRGRPRMGLRLTEEPAAVAVVLWSHGSVDLAIFTYDGHEHFRRRLPAPGQPDLDNLVAVCRPLIRSSAAHAVPGTVVVGLPTPYGQGVGLPTARGSGVALTRAMFSEWFPADPAVDLERSLGVPVLAENDANLGALGETVHGAGKAQPCVLYIKLSARGIGAGIVYRGRLFEGGTGFAGEVAHLRVDDTSQELCACGSRGCLELKLGSRLLEPLRAAHGTDLSYADLLDLVARDDAGSIRILRDAGRTIGRPLADVCTFLNPSALIVDAGTDAASHIVTKGMTERIDLSSPPFINQTMQTRISLLGDAAALYGGLEYARQHNILRGHATQAVHALDRLFARS